MPTVSVPAVRVAVLALVIAGAWLTVSVKSGWRWD